MHDEDLAHLDWLARLDALRAGLAEWAHRPVCWEPLRPAQAMLKRILERMEAVRLRWEAPLVVATFGGTGTGKSSLVNALIGAEVTPAGKQRPTTRNPILLAHPDTNLAVCQIPLDRVEVVRVNAPLLRDIILLDCPDPDSSSHDDEHTNLDRLREMLPACDVLLYVSTQQKYRSAQVGEELGKAAESCRLVFIQTHADVEADIRDDWRVQLEADYSIAEMFYVDSRQALREQQQHLSPTGEFGRLLTFLSRELASTRRTSIRQANVLELLDQGMQRCRAIWEPHLPALQQLEQAILEQRQKLGQKMTSSLARELLACRGLWERRLLEHVTNTWGSSPFSALLRVYQAQAMLLASWSLFRARNTAQLVLWGAWQGSRWLGEKQSQLSEEQRLQQLSELGIAPADLTAADMTLAGYLHSAQMDRSRMPNTSGTKSAGASFLADTTRRLDDIVSQLSRRNSGPGIRCWYETAVVILPAFLLYRIGKNFFYDSFWLDRPLLDVGFYIPAGIFLALWFAFWLWRFLARLRRGMNSEIHRLTQELSQSAAFRDLFADLEDACCDSRETCLQLERMQDMVKALQSFDAEQATASRSR